MAKLRAPSRKTLGSLFLNDVMITILLIALAPIA